MDKMIKALGARAEAGVTIIGDIDRKPFEDATKPLRDWAEGQYDRLAGLAADLVRQQDGCHMGASMKRHLNTDRLRYFPAAIVTVTRGSTLCGAHPHRAMFPACTQSCDALSRGEQFSIATDLFAHPASIYWRDWLFSKKHHPSSHACSPIAIDSRHVAGRVDRRPYAEVGNTL
jgi:hypothetical protein